MKISPFHQMVLVERVWLDADQQYPKTELIEVPDAFAHELTPFGVVMVVGETIQEDLAPGDKVLFNCHSTLNLETNSTEDPKMALVHEVNIQATLDRFPKHAIVVQDGARQIADAQGVGV